MSKVLILSRVFPAYHPRHGEATEFAEKYLGGRKIHTLRENKNGYYKDGDTVSIRMWSGKPYASKQMIIKDGVRIGIIPVRMEMGKHGPSAFCDVGRGSAIIAHIASNDGLDLLDFVNWFFPSGEPGFWQGDIIHFTGFRYMEE